jgi:predicted MPP superfamily phosphohydrolase
VGPKTDLYVNAGIGHSIPGLRAGPTSPEIAVFELDPEVTARASFTRRASWR